MHTKINSNRLKVYNVYSILMLKRANRIRHLYLYGCTRIADATFIDIPRQDFGIFYVGSLKRFWGEFTITKMAKETRTDSQRTWGCPTDPRKSFYRCIVKAKGKLQSRKGRSFED